MDLIGIIIIIVIISKVVKKGQDETDRIKKNTTVQNPWDQVASQMKRGENQRDQWKQQTLSGLEQVGKKAMAKLQEIEKVLELEDEVPIRSTDNTSAMEQVRQSRVSANTTTITQRAKENADVHKEDVTLRTLEAEHQHSERVSAAVHHHPEDEIPENLLGSIEDIMVKGYDGNLCFERDFVGEAMDMINRFTVPSDAPNV